MDLFVIGLILIVGFAIIIYLLLRKKETHSGDALVLIQNQLRDALRGVELQFSESQRTIREQTQMFSRDLTEMKETNKQVLTITDQLRNLEKVLKHQKQRGNLGEAALELVLSNVLPPGAYKNQYTFKDGKVVDAVIITKEGMIPVDAKFSLDNYDRVIREDDPIRREELEKEFKNDLKKRIDETAQYIRPGEGTLPFALMFIPAEGIYYDLLVNEIGSVKVNTRSLIEYAYKDKNVIIVSPTTFMAYLQTILYGFRAFTIEKSARDIIKRVEELARHLLAYESYIKKVGAHLDTAQNAYKTAEKEFNKVEKDILKLSEKKEE